MTADVRLLGPQMADNIRFDICWVEGLDPLCWVWTGDVQNRGYGCLGCRADTTHTASYRILVGSIPKGLTLDHLCRNKLCCNPAHLEPVTIQENVRRAVAARRAGVPQCNGELARAEFYKAQGRAAADVMGRLLGSAS